MFKLNFSSNRQSAIFSAADVLSLISGNKNKLINELKKLFFSDPAKYHRIIGEAVHENDEFMYYATLVKEPLAKAFLTWSLEKDPEQTKIYYCDQLRSAGLMNETEFKNIK